MTASRSNLAAIRFGFGHHGQTRTERSAETLLGEVSPAALKADLRTQPNTPARIKSFLDYRKVRQAARKGEMSEADEKKAARKIAQTVGEDFRRALLRPMVSEAGFRERLHSFWADHFTVSAKGREIAFLLAAYHEEAIRPHLGGDFADMLIAVVSHPAMLMYLDQQSSVGPGSVIGKRRGLGLNENLAREVLELHTLGVGSGYTQEDVRQLAELFTGLRFNKDGFRFNPRFAEPGAETVLGVTYGGRTARLDDIKQALRDIALRPETARHLARKLAVHFVSDTPAPKLIDHIAAAYTRTGGNLTESYRALLEHPSAWGEQLEKVKRPSDFMISALRAMSFTEADMNALSQKEMRQGLQQPMQAMGQRFMRPPGPDGWPEAAEAWITPATLAARIEWATNLARRFGQDRDPRAFLDRALGDAASANTRFLVGGAESKWEGVALVLASPEFNRR